MIAPIETKIPVPFVSTKRESRRKKPASDANWTYDPDRHTQVLINGGWVTLEAQAWQLDGEPPIDVYGLLRNPYCSPEADAICREVFFPVPKRDRPGEGHPIEITDQLG